MTEGLSFGGDGSFAASGILVTGPGEARMSRLRSRPLRKGEVRIRTQFSGISTGTDRWVIQGRFVWGTTPYPFVPGYQRSGVIVELGPGVANLQVGQPVVATTALGFVGAEASWGSHVSEAISPAAEVIDADGIDPSLAALFVSGQVGVNASGRVLAGRDTRVVVVGDGIIGACAALAGLARGFEVLLVGRHDSRLQAIEKLGVKTANSRRDGREQTEDFRPLAAIDTVQSDDSFATYVDALPRETGQVVFSGHSPDGLTHWADMAELQKRELTSHFVSGWSATRNTKTLALMRECQLPLGQLVDIFTAEPVVIERVMTSLVAGFGLGLATVIDWRNVE